MQDNKDRFLDINWTKAEQCPACNKFALVTIVVNSHVDIDPNRGELGKKCMWCGKTVPKE